MAWARRRVRSASCLRAAVQVGYRLAACRQFGLWRSLVAHLTGGQGVAGSNPVSPTRELAGERPYAEESVSGLSLVFGTHRSLTVVCANLEADLSRPRLHRTPLAVGRLMGVDVQCHLRGRVAQQPAHDLHVLAAVHHGGSNRVAQRVNADACDLCLPRRLPRGSIAQASIEGPRTGMSRCRCALDCSRGPRSGLEKSTPLRCSRERARCVRFESPRSVDNWYVLPETSRRGCAISSGCQSDRNTVSPRLGEEGPANSATRGARMRTPLLLSSFVAAMLFFTCTAAPASAGIPEWTFFCTPTPRVVLTTGAVSEGEARGISDDGRYVLFQAMFSGVPLSGVVSKSSFYVADLRTGQCVGMEGIGAECVGISDSGRIVFFTTRDALDPRDTNKNEDAYVWNLDTGAKELVALDIGGVCYPTSSGVTISGDGNWVVYTHGFDEVRPISIRNIRTGERALLSDDSGLRPAAISDDGSRILDDIGGLIGTKGASGWSWVKPDYGATNPTVAAYQWSISGDGTKVVFIDETGTSPFGMVFRDAFVYDITTQTKAAVPLANFGSNMVHGARVSDDGRFVSLVNDEASCTTC